MENNIGFYYIFVGLKEGKEILVLTWVMALDIWVSIFGVYFNVMISNFDFC